MSRKSRRPRTNARTGQTSARTRGVALVLLVAVVWLGRAWLDQGRPDAAGPGATTAADASSTAVDFAAGERQVLEFFANRRSGRMVSVSGNVDAVLPDDDDGSPHQRFIVRLSSGHTLLVAHNIDLAPRVPLRAGDDVRVRGEYEWNDRGGVLHWTHHDPAGDRLGGWIELDGSRYR